MARKEKVSYLNTLIGEKMEEYFKLQNLNNLRRASHKGILKCERKKIGVIKKTRFFALTNL